MVGWSKSTWKAVGPEDEEGSGAGGVEEAPGVGWGVDGAGPGAGLPSR